MSVQVSDLVRQKAEVLGPAGLAWLARLDDLVSSLERAWGLTVGRSLVGGTEAFVAEATLSDGTAAILKVALPAMAGNTVLDREVAALTIAAGHGYARLLRHDAGRRALLIERLGTPMSEQGLSTEAQLTHLCATLQAAWVSVPGDAGLEPGDAMVDWFTTFITDLWHPLGQPCSAAAIDRAMTFLRSRKAAFDRSSAVLVHGDAHSGNVLVDPTRPQPAYRMIDPDGLVAEPAYDLGVLMREWTEALAPDPVRLGLARRDTLCRLTGAPPQAVWEWGYIQAIATGLFLLQLGHGLAGREMLQVAEAWKDA